MNDKGNFGANSVMFGVNFLNDNLLVISRISIEQITVKEVSVGSEIDRLAAVSGHPGRAID